MWIKKITTYTFKAPLSCFKLIMAHVSLLKDVEYRLKLKKQPKSKGNIMGTEIVTAKPN